MSLPFSLILAKYKLDGTWRTRFAQRVFCQQSLMLVLRFSADTIQISVRLSDWR
jgi:hypothetical protein